MTSWARAPHTRAGVTAPRATKTALPTIAAMPSRWSEDEQVHQEIHGGHPRPAQPRTPDALDRHNPAAWAPTRALAMSRRRRQSRRRPIAHAVSSWREDSCSLRSTEETCVSTVLTEMNSSLATSLYW